MNRKKFFTLFSTSILGITLLKANPLNFFTRGKNATTRKSVEVKVNPHAVDRKKSERQDG
jgi:hypothetical protein